MHKVTVITKKTEVITLKTGPRGPQGIQGLKGDQGDVNLTQLNTKVDKTTTVNSKALSSNITINASDVPNTPAGNISATNVQNAINELDNEKANRTQEAWITPTLLNGATTNVNNPIRYRKSQFGVVEVNGELTSGSGVCFNLPVGYLPAINRTGRQPIVTVTGTTLGVFTIVAQNAVFITQGAAYSLSGVQYIAEA